MTSLHWPTATKLALKQSRKSTNVDDEDISNGNENIDNKDENGNENSKNLSTEKIEMNDCKVKSVKYSSSREYLVCEAQE